MSLGFRSSESHLHRKEEFQLLWCIVEDDWFTKGSYRAGTILTYIISLNNSISTFWYLAFHDSLQI